MVPARTAHAVLVILAILAIALLVVIARPFATSLFVAAVLAGALSPWTNWLARLLRGRRKVAAGLVTSTVLVAAIGPLSALGAMLAPQIVSGVAWVRAALQSGGVAGIIEKAPAPVKPLLERIMESLPASMETVQEVVSAQGSKAAAVLGNLLSATGTLVFQTVLMLVALFFLLLDGPSLVGWLNEAIPLKRGQVSELLHEFRRVTVAVLLSTLATAGVQSVLALAGFLVAGVPNPVFFFVATFVLGLVPFVGATLVVVAVGVLRMLTGHVGSGVFLVIWGLAVVGTIDNVLKPLFIRGGVPIHGAVIFFALIGGLLVFGPVGFLVGPLSVAFLVAVVRMYRRDWGGR
jgi:predicted PurR-regulated permease PerM